MKTAQDARRYPALVPFALPKTAAKQYIAVQTCFRVPMSLSTLNDVFFAATERNLDHAMLYREAGKWLPLSTSDLRRNVAGTVHALQVSGIRKPDRVAILTQNRPE